MTKTNAKLALEVFTETCEQVQNLPLQYSADEKLVEIAKIQAVLTASTNVVLAKLLDRNSSL